MDSRWGTGFSSTVETTVIKRITGAWQLVLFFDNPVEISSVWGAKKVFENKLSKTKHFKAIVSSDFNHIH